MGFVTIAVLAVLTGITRSQSVTIRPEAASADRSPHPNAVLQMPKKEVIFGQVRKNYSRSD